MKRLIEKMSVNLTPEELEKKVLRLALANVGHRRAKASTYFRFFSSSKKKKLEQKK
jgi:hypothetical protein